MLAHCMSSLTSWSHRCRTIWLGLGISVSSLVMFILAGMVFHFSALCIGGHSRDPVTCTVNGFGAAVIGSLGTFATHHPFLALTTFYLVVSTAAVFFILFIAYVFKRI